MASRAALQTVHLLTGEKTLVLDPKQVPDDTLLLTVVHWGEVLPKGAKPTADHIHRLKPAYKKDRDGPKTVYRMTRNEAGKFKHYWDVEKDGPRPPGKPRKKKEDDGASIIIEATEKKPKTTKKRDSPTASSGKSNGNVGEDAVAQARADLEAALKKLDAATSSSQKKQKK